MDILDTFMNIERVLKRRDGRKCLVKNLRVSLLTDAQEFNLNAMTLRQTRNRITGIEDQLVQTIEVPSVALITLNPAEQGELCRILVLDPVVHKENGEPELTGCN